ncbi:uncharacterized protein MELLADRAFT_92065 [Melampsora larici-populina 98AG31]|uniref:Uncharacterized protein n=1 Tax=Melampsora larici-populina (strain 98AG31 / pathotype 3-4-7) TaxID=747676 RepID=F4S1E5_MELLP|nr:uncharacterized protein MELLADRAFT_92065 [Melampsora larici-populina 98AG31]EGG01574.1 hypothetical protein MELLADRAFT_92065 [Melampsora larici-populina 98AG31]
MQSSESFPIIQYLKRGAGLNAYSRLTLRWSGFLQVEPNHDTCISHRKAYNASVHLNCDEGPVPVLLLQEGNESGQNLEGRLQLEGIVVQGGPNRRARLMIEDDACGSNSLLSSTAPRTGLNVRGEGMVLSDAVVQSGSDGGDWRLAEVMHREWDMQHLIFREFFVNYMYDSSELTGIGEGRGDIGSVLWLEGAVVNVLGQGGRWIVRLSEYRRAG